MSYYSDASLVLIPSGYKDQKIYSAKPTDGSGDLVFSRASDATRVDSNGLIEKVRTNLLLQSNTFSTTWTNTNTTETSGQAGYDGTNNAWLLDKSAASGFIEQSISLSGLATYSVYVKAGTATWVRLLAFVSGFSTDGSAYINLSNGTVGTTSNLISTKVESVGNGWYRVSIVPVNSPIASVRIYPAEANSTAAASGNILIQAAQLEAGDVMTDYIPTTTAAVSVGPVSGLPRLDYSGGCPSLLLEPQRTNSVPYSEQLDNAAWNKINVSVNANQADAPDGTTSADLVYPTTTGGNRLLEKTTSATAGQTWTTSFFVKASGFSWVIIYAPTGAGASWFNASTGVFGSVAGGSTAKVLGQVNGFWRVSITATLAGGLAYFYAGPADANGSLTATTSGTNGLLFWGCQLEAGSYATSYIPTLGSAVTRVKDAATKTGISSLIGQTEGVLFWEGIVTQLTDIIGTNRSVVDGVYITKGSGNLFRAVIYNSSNAISLNDTTIRTTNAKIALAYKSGDSALFVNGVKVDTDTSAITFSGALSDLRLNDNYLVGAAPQSANQILTFNTRLTDAQLAELTAL